MSTSAPSHPKPAGMIRGSERATRIMAAIAGAALTVFGGYMALLKMGDSLVSLSYDMPFIVHGPAMDDHLRIVYVNHLDEEVLDRRSQAKLLDKLGEAGVKAVAYDIIFDAASKDPAVDVEFAAAMRRFRGVDAAGVPVPGKPQRHVLLACGRKTFKMTGTAGEQLIPPTDVLLEAADDFGIVACDDDAYVIRKLPTGSQDEPSLIWKTAVAIGTPLDEPSRMQPRWINFAGPPPERGEHAPNASIPSCRADSILLGGVDTGFFRDKVVVIGGEPGIVGEALGKDLFATPFHRFHIARKLPLMSGVEVQANGLANLIQQNWLSRSSRRSDIILIIVAGILLGAALTYIRPVRAFLTALGLSLAAALAGVLVMHFGNVWFPWSVVAFLQVPLALVWGVGSRSYIERFFRIKLSAEQAAIRAAFAKYLSPQMLDRLTAEGFHTNLGGEKIQAAMMFTDLEGFTDMCERIGDPQRVVETLNTYFERTTGSIFDHDGIIIKYIGDAIYAAWGAPMADPLAPLKAVRAAWELHNRDQLVVDGLEIKTRIGLNFGDVVAGNTGSSRRVDYTLIGDAVNLAARLEGLNKMFGTHVLMSDSVHACLNGEFRTRRVGKFRVKGRKELTAVHELLGPSNGECEPAWIAQYHGALDALDANQHGQALEAFMAVNAARGPHGDGPSRFFIDHLQSNAPIENGTVTLKEK